MPANPARTALVIIAPAACALNLAGGVTLDAGIKEGLPLRAGVPMRLEGDACPNNAIYVAGLSYASPVMIWEA